MAEKCDFCGEPAEFVYRAGDFSVAVCYKHDRAIRIISAEEIITYLKECFSGAIGDFFKSSYKVKVVKSEGKSNGKEQGI